MMVLAHNLPAMNTQRQFGLVGSSKKKSTEKLSSGYKINRAADDAAGLSISEKMRKQIRGLTQASDNCQDGISYVQVADGALDEVQDMLQRMNILSVKAANGTNSDSDRRAINDELQKLKCEMSRVFTTTEFNEKKIWEPDTVTTNRTEIGTEEVVGVSRPQTRKQFDITNLNMGALPNIDDIKVEANDEGLIFSWTGRNDKLYESSIVKWPSNIEGTHTIHVEDYLSYPECKGMAMDYTYSVDPRATKEDVVNALDGDEMYCSIYAYTEVFTNFAEGYETRSSFATNFNYMQATNADVTNDNTTYLKPTNAGANCIINGAKTGDYDQGIRFEFEFDGGKAYADLLYARTSKDHKDINFGYCNSINDIKDVIDNSKSDDCTLQLMFTVNSDHSVTYPKSWGHDSGFEDGFACFDLYMTYNGNFDDVVSRLSNITGARTLVKGEWTSSIVGTIGNKEYKITVPKYEYEDTITESPRRSINIMAGAENDEANKIDINYDNLSVRKLGLTDTNTLTAKSATEAIDEIANALSVVSGQRSYFGAVQNRMEHTIKNLDNVVENTTAAESRIRDTDMAKEMVDFSKLNILEQAGQSMLAQANQSSQGVLSLLQ